MPTGLHAWTMLGVVILIGVLLLVRRFYHRAPEWFVRGEWVRPLLALSFLLLAVTGAWAHCELVWRAAGVDAQAPPNLPWYRLARDARPAVGAGGWSVIAWHAWAGLGLTLLLVTLWIGWTPIHLCLGQKGIKRLPHVLMVAVFLVTTTAVFIPRGRPGDVAGSDSPRAMTMIYILLAAAELMAGVWLIACATGIRPARPGTFAAGVIAAVTTYAAMAAALYLSTAWRGERAGAVFRQPRDLAYVITGTLALVVIAMLTRAARRGRRRNTLVLSTVVGVLIVSHAYLAILMLYDGSHGGSPLWRLQRPFVQRE